MISQLVFAVLTVLAFGLAGYRFKAIADRIRIGKDEKIPGSASNMIMFALGQKKMFRNVPMALAHGAVYVAFLITQIELIEIFVDGFTGKHRIFWQAWRESAFLLGIYNTVVSSIEVLSLLALIATFIFLARRNLLKIPRFVKPEMEGWPKLDGNIILYLEILLVFAIFTMNGADEALYRLGHSHAAHGEVGSFGFALSSTIIAPLFAGLDYHTLEILERVGWWAHLLVVFGFLNYLPISKHLHIALAFPNTYFTRPEPWGKMTNMPEIEREIRAMLDPSAAPDPNAPPPPEQFGAKDVTDLSWKSLLDAYTCTECGRCTAACPANQTGKKLSPRAIMMSTRDRLEEIDLVKLAQGESDGKALLGDHITSEELRACTSCNACVQECPVNINPLSIILELRRHLILDQSDAPEAWTMMFNNVENNMAPWQFSPTERAKWVEELNS